MGRGGLLYSLKYTYILRTSYILLLKKKSKTNPNKLTKLFVKTTNSGLKEVLTLSENVT